MDIIQSIIAIKSDAKVSVDNDDINKITWHDGNPTNITNEQILAKQTELKNIYNNNDYQRKREAEYPSVVDQLDDIYHNGINGWKSTIQTIKNKYPKE
tara:strand:+ start:795 stop:1088 length:294 start_codon:yes stop_codon:yes gene_type:complete